MQFFVHNCILAAGDEKWTENLVFLVIIGFWILGAVVKVLSKKAKHAVDKTQEVPAGPQKAQAPGRAREQFAGKPLSQKLSEIVQSYAEKQIQAQPKPKAQEISMPVKHAPKSQKVQTVSAGPSPLENNIKQVYTQSPKKIQKEQTGRVPALFDSLNELKKAVLYYEILGKPLSLRERPFY